MSSYIQTKLILGAIVGVVLAIYLVAEWLERRSESSIMRTRVNDGSDAFLHSRGSIWRAAVESTRKLFRPES